ncbi:MULTISPECIES: 5-methylcytosine restriction system specificity protein McrC [Sphingobacterium]|uniref:5-methylcytosine restriction system specificity protein McrC n=1 Tax=Sphingobacterium TaxID=28453 RepID=UPI0013DA64E5|nr:MULTISPECIES: restriction endonuclease [unclassified Sphingobacterium]
MKISLYEHVSHSLYKRNRDNENDEIDYHKWSSCLVRSYKDRRGKYYSCYKLIKSFDKIELAADYYIGIDWLIPGEKYIHIQPKINKYVVNQFSEACSVLDEKDTGDSHDEQAIREASQFQVNYLKMLLGAMSDPVVSKECTDLVRIEWDDTWIHIDQQDDSLTPFLVVQFLQLLKHIVRKGLKKSYYTVRENLNNRVKGKILVGDNLKRNVFKNRMVKTYCEYQVFGEDNAENQFLKKVFQFVTAYMSNHKDLFAGNKAQLDQMRNYIRPAFDHIGDITKESTFKHFKYNPFFKEYKEAIRIGGYILKRFGYNISRATETSVLTPPFWIDMPRLFELYVYQKLLEVNGYDRNKIRYQFSTYGNALDILVKDGENSMIIDAKYKLHYRHSHVHQDIRQVAGYARLSNVRTELGISNDRNIDCLIIYPDMDYGLNLEDSDDSVDELSLSAIRETFKNEQNKITAYYKVYKVGVELPSVQIIEKYVV